MKRSGFKHKVLTSAQKQIKEENRKWRQDLKTLSANTGFNQRSGSRTGARGQYYKGVWVSSQWELECLKTLELREKVGNIKNLKHREIITFKIYNDAGQPHQLQIEIDFVFDDLDINRSCRWDAKPPKVVHTKTGRKYPQKIHADWLLRFELLKFTQPDHDYRLLIKGNCYEDIDLNFIKD